MAKRGYVHIYQDSLTEIVKNGKHIGAIFRVWAYMMSKVEFLTNNIPVTQIDIAKELGLNPGGVCRNINTLIKQGIFEKVRQGRTFTYRLSRNFGWRGKGDDDRQKEFMESQ